MPDFDDILGFRYMSGVAKDLKPQRPVFAGMVPEERVDGYVAEWDVEKEDIAIDTEFTDESGAATPEREADVGHQIAKMAFTFRSRKLNAGKIAGYRKVGSAARDSAGRQMIDRNIQQMQRKHGTYHDDWMISRMFTGTLTLKIDGVDLAIDYRIPTENTPTASASWGTVGTNIVDDIRAWSDLISQRGWTAAHAFCNPTVMTRLMRNTDVKDLLGQTPTAVQIIEQGFLGKLMGLQWHVTSGKFSGDGETEKYTTPLIADNYVIIVPDFDLEWISMMRGTVTLPTPDRSTFIESPGPVIWTRAEDSPTAQLMYYKQCRMPVLKNPNIVVYANTGS